VALNDWKATRHAPPERRVLMGESLLVRYVEADQEPGAAEQYRENERRRRKREGYAAAFKAKNPDKQFRLNSNQSAECKRSPEGLRPRLDGTLALSLAECLRSSASLEKPSLGFQSPELRDQPGGATTPG
jgi:hypothetical protein